MAFALSTPTERTEAVAAGCAEGLVVETEIQILDLERPTLAPHIKHAFNAATEQPQSNSSFDALIESGPACVTLVSMTLVL